MLVDSHCHFNSLKEEDFKTVISSCKENGLFIDSSIDLESSKKSISISRENNNIYSSLGFHPFYADKFKAATIDEYQDMISKNKKIVAIGEIGLDYKSKVVWEKQRYVFIKFLKLARKNNLPVSIHTRIDPKIAALPLKQQGHHGFSEIFDILDEEFFSCEYSNIIFHCFSYSKNLLEYIVGRGGYISFSLNVLRNNKNILEALTHCPMENILLETDSPYMRVEGKNSTPKDIEKVYDFVLSFKGITLEQLKEKVLENTKKIFKMEEQML